MAHLRECWAYRCCKIAKDILIAGNIHLGHGGGVSAVSYWYAYMEAELPKQHCSLHLSGVAREEEVLL
jgi:hypothetical protein